MSQPITIRALQKYGVLLTRLGFFGVISTAREWDTFAVLDEAAMLFTPTCGFRDPEGSCA